MLSDIVMTKTASGLPRLTGGRRARETGEVRMIRSSAIALLCTVMTLCACAQAASAKNARARLSAAHRSVPATGQAVMRKKPPVARTPTQDEKSWMDRASVPSSSGGMGM
jgi:hypothetical protein